MKLEYENILNQEKVNSHSRSPSFFQEVIKSNSNQNIGYPQKCGKEAKINPFSSETNIKNLSSNPSNKQQPFDSSTLSQNIKQEYSQIDNKNFNLKQNETRSNFSAAKTSRKQQNKNFYLELQFHSKYKIENNIEDVFNMFLEEIKFNYKINNRDDIFRIFSQEDKNDIFIFRTFLGYEDKLEKKSFSESNPNNSIRNIKNISSSVFRKSAFSSFSVFDESKPNYLNCNNSKFTFINIEFFGLQKPTNKLVNSIGDIILEKKNIVKLTKYNQLLINCHKNKLLEELGINYFLNKSDQRSLKENSHLINEAASELYKNSKDSWRKIFSNFNLNNPINNNSVNYLRSNSSTNIKNSTLINNLRSFPEENLLNINDNKNTNNNILCNQAFPEIYKNNAQNPEYKNDFEIKNNVPDNFNKKDMKLIYELSEKINLIDIYPAFKKISNISKNFAEDLIEYFKILKNNDLIIYEDPEEKKKTIIIPELHQYCFFITVII